MHFSRALNILAIIIGMFFISAVCTADDAQTPKDKEKSGITWVKYDEGLKLAEKLDKMIFIDFYTSWCKFCHKMDKETFSNKEIIDYFNEHFIAVKVDAESKTKMKLPDGEYSGRDLARKFGIRGYPNYWFLKSSGEKITSYPGYAPPEKFLPVITFIGDGHYENMTFADFLKNNYKKD